MERRIAVLVVSGSTAAAGAAVLGIAWAVGAVAWAVADVPDAANDVLPELVLGFLGVVLVVVASVGAVLALARPGAASTRVTAVRSVAAIAAGVIALLLAVVGAGRVAGRAAADSLRPVLEETGFSNVPAEGAAPLVVAGAATAVVAIGLLIPGRRPRGGGRPVSA